MDQEKKLKRIIYILVGLIIGLCILFFKDIVLDVVTGNTPEKVVKTFYAAMIDNDYEKFIELQSKDEIEQYARKYRLTYDEFREVTKQQFAQLHQSTIDNGITLSDYKITGPSSYHERSLVYVKVEYLGYNEAIPVEVYVPVKRDLNKAWYIPQDQSDYGNLSYGFDETRGEVEDPRVEEVNDGWNMSDYESADDYILEDGSTDYYEPGQVYYGDLDGDGQEDEIKFTYYYGEEESYTVESIIINGDRYEIDRGFEEFQFNIVDIDCADRFMEIAISVDGYGIDHYTYFYRYRNGEIESLGAVEGKMNEVYLLGKARSIVINGDGFIHTYIKYHNLQTYLYDVTYRLSNDRLEIVYSDTYKMDGEVTLLVDLDVLREPDSYSDIAYTIWEGQKAYLLEYKGNFSWNNDWYYIENEKGQGGWFKVEDFIIQQKGYINTDVFENLQFAD